MIVFNVTDFIFHYRFYCQLLVFYKYPLYGRPAVNSSCGNYILPTAWVSVALQVSKRKHNM
jgi:hypothetical protein